MNRKLFWKLFLMFVAGIVAMFYLLNYLTEKAEIEMSMLSQQHKEELQLWGKQAQDFYLAGDKDGLAAWLEQLQLEQQTWAAVIEFKINRIAGERHRSDYYSGYNLGRSVDWKIHLYFDENPVMEIPFGDNQTSFLIKLPQRMRPGSYWHITHLTMLVFLPMLILALLVLTIYRYIMQPLMTLQKVTHEFTKGNFEVRAKDQLGNRNDELSELAATFDQMAERIGEQIVSQRQLIADLSHELRTPLTRLDIAVEAAGKEKDFAENLQRVSRESTVIRRLVEDALTLAWLENERVELQQEDLDLVDLMDVIVEDAKFEFPDNKIITQFPEVAEIKNSNHRAAGQALENIVRNALRYTPVGEAIEIKLSASQQSYLIEIKDNGPGVPEQYLNKIFHPFFRVDKSRAASINSFGLGLALARRQLIAIGGKAIATNRSQGGLCMTIHLPVQPDLAA